MNTLSGSRFSVLPLSLVVCFLHLMEDCIVHVLVGKKTVQTEATESTQLMRSAVLLFFYLVSLLCSTLKKVVNIINFCDGLLLFYFTKHVELRLSRG